MASCAIGFVGTCVGLVVQDVHGTVSHLQEINVARDRARIGGHAFAVIASLAYDWNKKRTTRSHSHALVLDLDSIFGAGRGQEREVF